MKTQLKTYHGTPTVFFDDRPGFFGCHLVGWMDPANPTVVSPFVRKYAEAGVHIYSVDNIGSEWVGPHPGSASHYDFSPVIPRLQAYIDVDPQALFLMRMCFETRWLKDNWWGNLYPDEVELLSDGRKFGHSYASTFWREQANDLLRDFIAYLKQVGLYDRTVAFQLDAGTSGEWIKDESSMQLVTADYSSPMRCRFRAWLRGRYQNDPVALQDAWADARVTFDTAEVPSFEEQSTTTTGHSFRDPRREQKVVDYYDNLAELCADDLLEFCRTAREVTAGEKLTGAFFGYILELAWNNCFFTGESTVARSQVSTIQRSGHLGLRKLLRSPDIDFFVSPYGYAFRGLGGDGLPMQPAEALRAHGKIYFMEEDTLMHNNFDPGGRNQSLENSVAVYQRNFAQCLTHGHAVTWFEVPAWLNTPAWSPSAAAGSSASSSLVNGANSSTAIPASDVAVFLDDESYQYQSIQNNLDLPLIWKQRVISLNRFGAPHDIYLLDDLLEGNLPPYKLYIFLNAFHLNNRRRAALKAILRRDNRVALWLYAPGFLEQ